MKSSALCYHLLITEVKHCVDPLTPDLYPLETDCFCSLELKEIWRGGWHLPGWEGLESFWACSLRLLTAPLYPATYQCTVGSESHCDKHHAPHVQSHKLMQQPNHYFQQQLNKSERGTTSKDNLTGQNDVSNNVSWPDIGRYSCW
jgi:hypothetical protein